MPSWRVQGNVTLCLLRTCFQLVMGSCWNVGTDLGEAPLSSVIIMPVLGLLQTMLGPLPSISFSVHYSLIILSFNTTQSLLLPTKTALNHKLVAKWRQRFVSCRPDDRVFYGGASYLWVLAWNLFFLSAMAPRILKWLVDFWKIFGRGRVTNPILCLCFLPALAEWNTVRCNWSRS